MGQAEELLNSLSGETVTADISGDSVIIGSDQVMTIPDNLKKLGVSPDHGVNTVHFIGPRYSKNGVDLSKMNIWVNYMRADGYVDQSHCENVTVDSEDDTLLHYDWVITRNVTEIYGALTVVVCAKEVDAAGFEDEHWNTERNNDFYVVEGLEVQESVITQYPDLVEYMLLRVATVENKTTKAYILNCVEQYLNEDPSVIIEHIEKIIAEQPIQEFVNEYLDNHVDICTTEERTLEGSYAEGGLRVNHMVGNTEQRTLSGKNELKSNISTQELFGITFTDNKDGTYMLNGVADRTTSSVYFAENLPLKAGTYNMVCSAQKDNPWIQVNCDGLAYVNGIFTLEKDSFVDVKFGFIEGTTFNNTVIKPMITTDLNATYDDFEPYCGGIPSPNPDYPQAIHNTGDCVEMIQGYYDYLTGVYSTNDNRICNKHSIPCNAGDTINLSVEDVNTVTFIYYNKNGYVSYTTGVTGTEYIVPSGVTSFNLYIFKESGLTPSTVGKIQLTINGKYVVQIVEHGKNFVKVDKINSGTSKGLTITYNKDGSITLNGTATEWDFENLNYKGPTGRNLPKGKYKLVNTNVKSAYFCVYVDGVKANTSSFYNAVFEITDDTVSDYIRYEIANGAVFDNVTIYPMIVSEDETDLTFEPYTESTATILLDEPLREGDRLVKVDGVFNHNHKCGVVDLGTLNWVQDKDWSSMYYAKCPEAKHGKSIKGNGCYCTHYTDAKKKNIASWAEFHETNNIISCGNVYINHEQKNSAIVVTDNRYTDVTEFKNAMNGVILEYELAEETLTPLDTASQIALNSLKTFDTVTYITVDSVTQPAELEVEYGKSKVGARVIKNENGNDIDRIERKEMKAQLNELATALVALGSEV